MNTFSDSLSLAWRLMSSLDPVLLDIVALSLRVSASACLLGALAGGLLGAWLAVACFPGRSAVLGLLNTLLALPSVVVGLAVYLLLSRSGPLGSLGLLFTPTAMVIAQSILVVPLIAALTHRLVSEGLQEGGDQLASLGAGPMTSAALLLLHQRVAALTILLTALGAVMIVGGNIAGSTRVMTTAIALETSKGDLPLALALGLVLLGVVGSLHLLIALVRWRAAEAGAGRGTREAWA
jgi:tungstate transport system permease protein/tungstate transport system ATP-binding protein